MPVARRARRNLDESLRVVVRERGLIQTPGANYGIPEMAREDGMDKPRKHGSAMTRFSVPGAVSSEAALILLTIYDAGQDLPAIATPRSASTSSDFTEKWRPCSAPNSGSPGNLEPSSSATDLAACGSCVCIPTATSQVDVSLSNFTAGPMCSYHPRARWARRRLPRKPPTPRLCRSTSRAHLRHGGGL